MPRSQTLGSVGRRSSNASGGPLGSVRQQRVSRPISDGGWRKGWCDRLADRSAQTAVTLRTFR
jgi:hypothetical protein